MSDLKINRFLTIPLSEFSFNTSRSSGSGGQNVNKVETKVELRWNIFHSPSLKDYQKQILNKKLSLTKNGELVLFCEKHKSQLKNKEEVLNKLQLLIQNSLKRPKSRVSTKPTRGSVESRLKKKKKHSDKKKNRKNFKDY